MLRVLGTRGIPAVHGGFETFAEFLGRHLVSRGWRVIVYCQEYGNGPPREDVWKGVERIRIPVPATGAKGSLIFDWRATRHAALHRDLCLTLGYNTAIFCALLRARGIPNLMNMDGMEWRRQKWGPAHKAWFYCNDWAGCWLADHLVADHPEIARHLSSRVRREKITTIPYGADRVTRAAEQPVRELGLEPGRYMTLIARAEPENSILEVVSAFSRRRRDCNLAVLGDYAPERNSYQRAVLAASSGEVRFLGAIYDQDIVRALRFHCLAYLHGHQVGGTNPSLLEAMAAGNPVIAHDNAFNRWVAGPAARYFCAADQLARLFDDILQNPEQLARMKDGAMQRHCEAFTWEESLGNYEQLLRRWLPA